MTNEKKPKAFKTEEEREVAVCIAVQKIGAASISEVLEKIEKWNGKITEKQASKCAENLRKRGILSIDLREKNDAGISIKRYVMKSIKFSVPEVGQVTDIVNDDSVKELKDELERSKKMQKKGMKTFDYYKFEVVFDTEGDIQGFIPDKEGIKRHYRDQEGNVVFYHYHFQNWLRGNFPLLNRTSSAIGDIYSSKGMVVLNGSQEFPVIEKYITNVESGFSGSKGTGGRGVSQIECLAPGVKILTNFKFPRAFVPPERIKEFFEKICNEGGAFGGGAKLSTGKLRVADLQIVNDLMWEEN